MVELIDIINERIKPYTKEAKPSSFGNQSILRGMLTDYFVCSDILVSIKKIGDDNYSGKIELTSGGSKYILSYINNKIEIKHPRMNDDLIGKFNWLSNFIVSLIKGDNPDFPELK